MQVEHKNIIYSDRFIKDKKPTVEIKDKENTVTFINCHVDWVAFCEQLLGFKFKWYQKLYLTTYYKLRYLFKTKIA